MATAQDAKRRNARQPGKMVSAALGSAMSLVNRERTFRKVRNDLSALTDTELNELGLSRNMIRPLARQAARAA